MLFVLIIFIVGIIFVVTNLIHGNKADAKGCALGFLGLIVVAAINLSFLSVGSLGVAGTSGCSGVGSDGSITESFDLVNLPAAFKMFHDVIMSESSLRVREIKSSETEIEPLPLQPNESSNVKSPVP